MLFAPDLNSSRAYDLAGPSVSGEYIFRGPHWSTCHTAERKRDVARSAHDFDSVRKKINAGPAPELVVRCHRGISMT
jgi:hypothetical protein